MIRFSFHQSSFLFLCYLISMEEDEKDEAEMNEDRHGIVIYIRKNGMNYVGGESK